jgi:hypothetical protein
MCTYSMIAKDWMNPHSPNHIPLPNSPWYPTPPTFPPFAPLPVYPSIPAPVVTPDLAKQMLDILKKVDELDKKLGRLDCLLDADAKKAYVKALRTIAKQKKCPCKKKKAKAKKTEKVLLNE